MTNLRVNGCIWLETTADPATETFIGRGQIELLLAIQHTGSINQAAKAIRMSYKRAWGMVRAMNTVTETPLVKTQIGGEKGGGAIVTREGEKYLALYNALSERFQLFLILESTNLSQ